MAVEPTGPLAGITVLEVGAFMAAPFATMQLADLGARVLKVENPTGGDPVRATGPFLDGESSPFVRLNRNKESVALDLKSADGKQAFLRLVARADVLVENLRPGAMTGLGFGYEAIREVNPAHRLRVGVRVGAGRPAGRAAGAGHHGAGARRPHEHHRHAGRRPGQGRRAHLRPRLRALRRAGRHRGAEGAGPLRRGPVPGRLPPGVRRLVRDLGGRQVLRHRRGRPPARLGTPEHGPVPGGADRGRPRHGRRGHPEDVEGAVHRAGPRGPAGRRALRRRLHAARPPGHPHPRDRGGHHHADHRRGGRARSTRPACPAPRSPTTARCSPTIT